MGINDHVEPKKRKNATGKQSTMGESYSAEFKGYINLELSDPQKADWAVWHETAQPFAWMESAAADGVNLSLRIDPKSGGYLASATQRREGSPNAGLCVTARGRESWVALSRVLYCLALLTEGETWEAVQPRANPDRW